MKVFPRLLLLTLVAALAPAASASADTLLDGPVAVPDARAKSCVDGPASGAGVTQRRVTVPALGVIAARLTAAEGDWDVAVFDAASGRRITGAAGFGAEEVATGFSARRDLIVQACRRKGDARTAQLTVTTIAFPENEVIGGKVALLKVKTPERADKARLQTLGLDLTEHAGHDYVEVVAYGERDLDILRSAGFTFDVEVDDMVARALAERRADRVFAQQTQRSALPSGRDGYRHLVDYEADMKSLVEKNPGLVKPLVLKEKTLEGRNVNGIEITQNANVADGKPIFMQMGVHHAREWPSAEHAMEFAVDLIKGYGSNPRITNLVNRVRTVVVPVVNPDGFNVSREAAFDPLENDLYTQRPDADPGVGEALQTQSQTPSYLADPAGAYKRRNCRLDDNQSSSPAGACALPAFRTRGVDPNRNYGGLWGGAGASVLPAYDTYRGAGPFSEPETRNIKNFISERHVTTFITNHTFSNLVLRPPGVKAQGPPADEPIYRDLGRRMAEKNGYTNQPSYALYDTTGSTEDWSYYSTGGLGFTFEIGPDVAPANCGGFHPRFECTVQQYTAGSNNGGGNREAYLVAMENAADATKHSTLTGRAPEGVTLRLKKSFVTNTSPVRPLETDVVDNSAGEGSPIGFRDDLNSTLPIRGNSGRFTWSVNPSTRPAVAERLANAGPVLRTQKNENTKQTVPSAEGREDSPLAIEDVPFEVPAGEPRVRDIEITFKHKSPSDDYDLNVYRVEGEGADAKFIDAGSSGNGPGSDELAVLEDPKPGKYVMRVVNYAAFAGWTSEIVSKGDGPLVRKQGMLEPYTLTCELGSRVIAEQRVIVRRGETLDVKEPCGANAEEVVRGSRASCATSAGFKSAGIKRLAAGRRVRFEFARRVANRVRIDVFQSSVGRRIVGERRVATFRGLTRSFTWDGTGNDGKKIRDGVFFVRYQVKGSRRRTDFRRMTLVRRNGRFTVRRTFYRPDSCGLLASAKLERPVFGGRSNRPLRVAFRVARRANVTIQVLRGKRVVGTVRTANRAARRTHRLRLPSERVRRGLVKVRITVVSRGRRATATLIAQRL